MPGEDAGYDSIPTTVQVPGNAEVGKRATPSEAKRARRRRPFFGIVIFITSTY